MKDYRHKIVILILLIIIFVLLNILRIEPVKEEVQEIITQIEINLTQEKEEFPKIEETEIIVEEIIEEKPTIEDFINYKYHTRLQKLAINRLKFNSKFFGIEEIIASEDYNNNGIDDYTDILIGAKEFVNKNPEYISEYYIGGYPPEGKGVCTDVVWSALKNAGYDLKSLVDEDIRKNTKLYRATNGEPDPNIDFRRVRNLDVYFPRFVESLSTDFSNIEDWQPGDIVTFSSSHIGVVSNYRNYKGIPYLIHHGGRRPAGEDNVLESPNISGHYRINFLKEEG